MSTTKYYLRTLGGLSLESSGQPLPGLATQRKRLALLALLAATGERGMGRDKILAYLWPESNSERARNTLYQFIHVLKRELGDVIVPSNGELKLNRELIGSDLNDFRESLGRREFARAVELYRGPFLDGVFLREAAEFERWIDGERNELAAAYASALEQLAAEAQARGDHQACVHWRRMRASLDPLSARSTRAYIDALVQAGDRAAALQYAQQHFALTRSELGVEPESELQAYVAGLRTQKTILSAPASTPDTTTNVSPAIAPVEKPRAGRWRSARWAVIAAGMVVVLVTSITLLRHSTAPKRADSSRVLVAPFINHSGDRGLDVISDMAADWTTQALAESELVDVVDWPTALQSSRYDRQEMTVSDSEAVRRLAQRTDADIVLWGTLYLVHDSIVLQARISNARDGSVLRAIPLLKAAKTDPMPAIEQLRERAVGALALLLDNRLASLSTRSGNPPMIEAYRDYLQGLDILQRSDQKAAISLFLRASQRDTTFTLPLIWAYLTARNFFDPTVARRPRADSILNVLELRQAHLAPLDRYVLEYLKLERNASSREARLVALRQITALAPRSNWSYVEATLLFAMGRGEEARAALRHIEKGWVPSWRSFWSLDASLQHYLGDFRAELHSADSAARIDPATGVNPRVRALIGLGRVDSARAVIDNSSSFVDPSRKVGFQMVAARELRAHGYHAQSDSMFAHVLAWFRSAEVAAVVRNHLYHAQMALEAGEFEESRQLALGLIADSTTFSAGWERSIAHGVLGVAAAYLGDRRAAETEMRVLEAMQMADPYHATGPLTAQAHIAGALGNRKLAIRYLALMQAAPNTSEPAGVRAHFDRSLQWLDGDPAIRKLR